MPVNSRKRHSTWVSRVPDLGTALLAALVVMTVGSCAGGSDVPDPYAPLRGELAPFAEGERSGTPSIRAHYSNCDGGAPGVIHDTWRFSSRAGTMAVHVWRPTPEPASPSPAPGTILLVHGYLASPCELTPIIGALLEDGYVVVAPELPGHGLSDGPRGDIGSFSEYAQFLIDVDPVLFSFPEPYGVMAHSTGASAIIERLRTADDPYDQIVLLAPLVRPRGYGSSRVFRWITRPFIHTIPARNAGEFGFERIPLHWFDALVEWNGELEATDLPISQRELRVVQGRADRVVAWRYNFRVLTGMFPEGEQIEIDGLSHVPSGRTEAGQQAIAAILAYLTAPE